MGSQRVGYDLATDNNQPMVTKNFKEKSLKIGKTIQKGTKL